MTRACCIALLSLVSIAHAQREDGMARARALFEQGVDELHAGHAAVGRDLLRRSNDLVPTFAAQFNLGVALRRTGEPTEATRLFEALLERNDLSADERERVREQLAQARAETSTIEVRVQGAPRAQVEVDGVARGTLSPDETVRVAVDPGEHAVTARAGTDDTRRVTVAAGDVERLELHVEPEQVRVPNGGDDTAWIWIVTTTAIALLAGGIVATLVALDNQPKVIVDPVTGVRETLGVVLRF